MSAAPVRYEASDERCVRDQSAALEAWHPVLGLLFHTPMRRYGALNIGGSLRRHFVHGCLPVHFTQPAIGLYQDYDHELYCLPSPLRLAFRSRFAACVHEPYRG